MVLEITIFATNFFFRREKTSLSGTSISLPKIADLPISFQANITCMAFAEVILMNTHNICTCRGDSNEYPQHMLLPR